MYGVSARIIELVVLFIMFPLILIVHDLLWHIATIFVFVLMFLWSISMRKGGKTEYDERELRVASRAHGFALVLSLGYVVLIAMVLKEVDFGSLLPLVVYSTVPFQIITNRLIFEILKRMPNAEESVG